MKIYKIKSFLKGLQYQLALVFSFPYFWMCVFIILIAAVSLLVSFSLHKNGQEYLSSVLANIFAGLVTGLIICLLSGVKQFYIAKLKNKKIWLEVICSMIGDYKNQFHELLTKPFTMFNGDEELFAFIYDVGACANAVNEHILQSTFDKRLSFNSCNYCKKYLHYDAVTLSDDYNQLHMDLYEIDINQPSKKEIIQYFSKIDRNLKQLNSNAIQQIKDIDVRLHVIEQSIV